MPQEVGIKGAFMEAVFSSHFKNSRFKLERVENSVSLTIPHPTKDDEAMYYCGISVMKMIKFSTGTFLAITALPVPQKSALLVMGLALGLFAVWNVTLCCVCMKWKICKHCRGSKPDPDIQDLSRPDTLQDQEGDDMELYYSTFSETDTKRGKKKRRRPQDDVYSEVIYSSQKYIQVLFRPLVVFTAFCCPLRLTPSPTALLKFHCFISADRFDHP
ncbi:hypothetical protein MHYP_G00108120 [Metynnis hypsauchen]